MQDLTPTNAVRLYAVCTDCNTASRIWSQAERERLCKPCTDARYAK